MVFVEFINTKGKEVYFVGQSLKSVLKDTAGGTEFGPNKFTSYKKVSGNYMEGLKDRFPTENIVFTGVITVAFGKTKSFFLGTPKQ